MISEAYLFGSLVFEVIVSVDLAFGRWSFFETVNDPLFISIDGGSISNSTQTSAHRSLRLWCSIIWLERSDTSLDTA